MNDEISKKNMGNMQKTIELTLCIYGSDISYEGVKHWFEKMTYFKPWYMTLLPNFNGKKYKDQIFWDTLKSNIENHNYGYIYIEEKFPCEHQCLTNKLIYKKDSCKFTSTIYIEHYIKNKEKILNDFSNLMKELNGCVGYIVNYFDDVIEQNPSDIGAYEEYGLEIPNIPLLPKISVIAKVRLDKEYLPGHKDIYNQLIFTAGCYNWIGPDYYTFLPRDKVESFKDCIVNKDLNDGFRLIILHEDVENYRNDDFRRRQWAFRKHIGLDETLHILKNKTFIYKNEQSKTDPTIEFKIGEYEHGGTLLAIYYIDEHGKSVSKSKAYECVIREMKDNDIVWSERKKIND